MKRPDGHDELCPWPERTERSAPPPPEWCDQCDLIHTVREDIASRIDALPWDLRTERKRTGLGMRTFMRRDAYLRAARVARGEQ